MILPADVTLFEFAKNETLFAGLNPSSESWWAWDVVFKVLSHLPLDKTELEFWKKITGLFYDPREKLPSIIVIVAGRKSAKSTKAGQIGIFRGLQFDRDAIEPPMTPGEQAQIIIVSPALRSSKPIMKFCAGQIDSLVENTGIDHPVIDRKDSKDELSLELSNGCTIATMPANVRISGRGPSTHTLIMEEAAHFKKIGDFSDTEVFKACRPGMVRFGLNSLCVIITSPDTKEGLVWSLYDRFYGKKNRVALIINAPTRDFNPTADEEFLEIEKELFAGEDLEGKLEYDESYFQREYESKFTDATNQAFPSEMVDECVIKGRERLPFSIDHDYFGFVDPATLTQGTEQNDEFAIGIAHVEARKGRYKRVIDVIQAWSPDIHAKNFATHRKAVEEAIELAKTYELEGVVGDHGSGQEAAAKFEEESIAYDYCDLSKSDLYGEFLSVVNNKDIELPDDPKGTQQLKGLETKKNKIDHAPRRKDDRPNVYAGLSYLASKHITALQNGVFRHSLGKISKASPQTQKREKHNYCAGLVWPKDTGFMVLAVLDSCCRELCFLLRIKRGPYQRHLDAVEGVIKDFGLRSILAEPDRIGESLFEQLRRDKVPVKQYDPPSRNFAIEAFVTAAEKDQVKVVNDRFLLREMRAFICEPLPSGSMRYRAVGYQGGCVFALALAWQGVSHSTAKVSDVKTFGLSEQSTDYDRIGSAADVFKGAL